MSHPRQFLICDDLAHAAVCDLLVCEYFRDVDGSKASAWSGVYAKPGDPDDTYAVLWMEDQLRAVFGDDPLLVIEEETENDDWQTLPPPEPPTDEELL